MPYPRAAPLPNVVKEKARPVLEGKYQAIWARKLILPSKFRASFPFSEEELPTDVESKLLSSS